MQALLIGFFFLVLAIIWAVVDNDIMLIGNLACAQVWLAADWLAKR